MLLEAVTTMTVSTLVGMMTSYQSPYSDSVERPFSWHPTNLSGL